ncbi:MAG: hypothetical protein ABI461_14775 [Polyangiaceae bacterium]
MRSYAAFWGAPALAIGAIVSLSGCMHPTGAAAAQEAARQLTTNLRFGRMELVMEHVAPSEMAAYVASHKTWGGSIRIAEAEIEGLRLTGKDEATITVRISWYETSTQELRQTMLRQTWHDQKGDWLLTAEARADGDLGLFGEKVPAPPVVDEPHRTRQFETVRLPD